MIGKKTLLILGGILSILIIIALVLVISSYWGRLGSIGGVHPVSQSQLQNDGKQYIDALFSSVQNGSTQPELSSDEKTMSHDIESQQTAGVSVQSSLSALDSEIIIASSDEGANEENALDSDVSALTNALEKDYPQADGAGIHDSVTNLVLTLVTAKSDSTLSKTQCETIMRAFIDTLYTHVTPTPSV